MVVPMPPVSGTTIFYVLGGMMFVGAALILIVRRKAEADEI